MDIWVEGRAYTVDQQGVFKTPDGEAVPLERDMRGYCYLPGMGASPCEFDRGVPTLQAIVDQLHAAENYPFVLRHLNKNKSDNRAPNLRFVHINEALRHLDWCCDWTLALNNKEIRHLLRTLILGGTGCNLSATSLGSEAAVESANFLGREPPVESATSLAPSGAGASGASPICSLRSLVERRGPSLEGGSEAAVESASSPEC